MNPKDFDPYTGMQTHSFGQYAVREKIAEPEFLKDPFEVSPTPALGMPAVRPTTDTEPAPAPEPHSLTFKELREKNQERMHAAFYAHRTWGPAEWSLSAAGEVGELCNAVKKRFLRRDEDAPSLQEIGHEIADVVIYLDLLASRLGFHLEDLVAEKFNIVSEKKGVEIFL